MLGTGNRVIDRSNHFSHAVGSFNCFLSFTKQPGLFLSFMFPMALLPFLRQHKSHPI